MLELTTSDTAFDKIHRLVEKARQNGKVSIDKQTMVNLLIDHSRILNALRDEGVQFKTPRGRSRLK